MKLLNILTIIFTLGLTLSSCQSDSDFLRIHSPERFEGEEGEELVNLYLDLMVNDIRGGTRADDWSYEAATVEWEKLKTVRVIIVRLDAHNIVEHNTRIYLDANEISSQSLHHVFAVVGAEMKRVYVIGNEDSLPEEIRRKLGDDVIKVGEPLPFNMLGLTLSLEGQNKVFINNSDKTETARLPIPMSEYFDIRVKAAVINPEENKVEAPLFITRALTKFSFTAKDADGSHVKGIKIKSIKIDNLSDCEWLFPRNAIYNPGKYNDATGDKGREIIFYTVPESANYGSYTFQPEAFGVPGTGSTTPDLSKEYEPYEYFLESDIPLPGSDEYKITVTTEEGGIEITYPSVGLPNLPRLPRNTHVKVEMSFTKQEIGMQVDLVPYTGIELKPTFGSNEIVKPPKPRETTE